MRKRKYSVESEKCHLSRLFYPPRTSIVFITIAINSCPAKSSPKTGTTFKCTEFFNKLTPDPNKNPAFAVLGECLTNIAWSISIVRNESKQTKCNKSISVNNTGNSGLISTYIWIYQKTNSYAVLIKDRIFNIFESAVWLTGYQLFMKDIVSPISVYKRNLALPKNKISLIDYLLNLTDGYADIERLNGMSSKPLIDKIIFIKGLHS